ncbi:MAG: aldehyde ferredoxin oxidoreductase, partial [Spirochaetales bacterium]
MNTIIRVNTRTRQVTINEATEEQKRWGGRSFIAHTLLGEVAPNCEPTGRRNKLIIASGLIADTNVSTTGQISVGGKSPLTGGVKESNVGGMAGKKFAKLGIKALILEETPAVPSLDILEIRAGGCKLVSAPEYRGKLVDETIAALRKSYGKKAGIFCIGPSGEMMMYGSGIASPDNDDIQIRYAARGGLGALMGSKGIKAIVIDDAGSEYVPAFHDKALLLETAKWMTEALLADP